MYSIQAQVTIYLKTAKQNEKYSVQGKGKADAVTAMSVPC
jgi:hypothetical protein